MDRYKAYLLPAGAAVLVLAYYGWRWSSSPDTPETPPSTEQPAAAAVPRTPAPEPAAKAEPDAKAEPRAPAPEASPSGPKPQAARDRAKRDALRDEIAAAQRARLKREDLADVEPDALGQLTKDYLQARVRDDFLPLAQECYDDALERDAALSGRLTLQIRIVGEPDVGGIVEETEPTLDSEITDPELVECMRESMMSMSFDPPENGGALQVTYPFVLSNDDAQ